MKHKHARFIKLMADGVRIECRRPLMKWVKADMCYFDWSNVEFRISPNQPADRRWNVMSDTKTYPLSAINPAVKLVTVPSGVKRWKCHACIDASKRKPK